MYPLVLADIRWRPVLKDVLRKAVDFCRKRITFWLDIRSARDRNITLRARTGRNQKINVRKDLEKIAFNRRARFSKVLSCEAHKPSAHEDVKDVMHVPLSKTEGQNSPCEIAMTTMVNALTGHDALRVRIAAAADDIMNARIIFVDAVCNRVRNDRGHGAYVRHTRPEAVAGGEMRGVQLTSFRGVKVLARIVCVP